MNPHRCEGLRHHESGSLLGCEGPALPDVGDQKKKQASGAIEENVSRSARAGGDKTLVPFIHGRNECGSYPGEQGSTPHPRLHPVKRRAPPAQQQQAQHAVAQNMSGLAEVVMEDKEIAEIDFPENAREDRIQHVPGILRREQIGRFKGDQTDPDHGRPPGAQEIGARSGQTIPRRSWELRG